MEAGLELVASRKPGPVPAGGRLPVAVAPTSLAFAPQGVATSGTQNLEGEGGIDSSATASEYFPCVVDPGFERFRSTLWRLLRVHLGRRPFSRQATLQAKFLMVLELSWWLYVGKYQARALAANDGSTGQIRFSQLSNGLERVRLFCQSSPARNPARPPLGHAVPSGVGPVGSARPNTSIVR